ncbi:RagB/SusD family nutrient uptake outer membrane protein [Pedobacter sp. HMWF019]|uniref:RagB/SusD family nutrient uptake outer membrane protein n=1 Tax=Pedobacter sp. HMWF019 TaxID=2056856 RepID=UPI001304ABEA|nr:RagB/SusD family nutrient uptake outer membrane protein [Pedobacter sp. HMWF019]
MRKYLYTMALAIAALGSCKKSDLNLYPYNQVETTQAFNTEGDVTLAVNGMYYGIRASGSYYNGTWNIVADVLADNLISSPAGRGTLLSYSRWLLSPTSTYGLFSGGYTIVRRANAIVENIDRFPAGAFHDNAKGEALALRAMTYFDMCRVYSKTYLNASATDFTLPYVTTTDAKNMPASESVKGFYDKVIADLNAALPLINANNGVGRLNKAAVAGLLSRVNLYKGDWTATITAANTALGSAPSLPSIANFPLIWTDQSSDGVLFKVINNAVDNINTQGVNYYQTQNGEIKSEYVVEYNFKQLFAANDVRTSTYIKTSALSGSLYNNVVKYAGGTGKPAGVQDAKVLRTAEVLLNRMEAYYRSGNEPAALADLNLLKRNRYTGFSDISLTGTALLNEILKERRLELAFEGDRFWDLKRRAQPVLRDGTKGEKADGTGTPYFSTTLTLPVDDHRFQLPYPVAETNFNTAIKQNPGY